MNKNIPLVIFTGLILSSCSLSSTSSTPAAPSPTIVAMVSQTPLATKDGVFQSDGSYTSPAGPETVGVKLTLANGLVSDVAVEVKATNPISKKMQTAFAGGIKEQVVGKKLADLNVTKVAGSSLTGIGFNQALEKIKAQM